MFLKKEKISATSQFSVKWFINATWKELYFFVKIFLFLTLLSDKDMISTFGDQKSRQV